jgi:hypothetical protein
MGQRPSFDLTKVSTADKILLGGSLLIFIDSLFSWQKGANAWGGNGGFVGTLMALFALLLFIGVALTIAQVATPPGIPLSTIIAGLTLGTVLFALIKFLMVIGNSIAFGAWIGLILAIVIAYGGFMKMQATKAVPTNPDAGFTP